MENPLRNPTVEISSLQTQVEADLRRLHAAKLHRQLRTVEGVPGPRMRVNGREVLMLAGSNYLDLAGDARVIKAAQQAVASAGCAAGGSRLINGNLSLHEELEHELASFVGSDAALVFSTGYMANVGVIPALAGPGDQVISDALSHASIIDGCRLSRAEVRIFPHGDLDRLAELLRESASTRGEVLVVVDGVYSMDGDVAPLAELVPLAKRWGATVLVDDAHGTGTLGATGRGSSELCGVSRDVDIVLGTLGKSLGSFGAFVAGSRALRDLLVNTARSFIFSCALAPPQVAAARAAFEVMRREPWRREQLSQNADRLRDGLAQRGISTAPSTTHIVPVIVGANDATMKLCEHLLESGVYAQGIRHPSVPEGTARLRITPMATHRSSEIDHLVDLLEKELVG